MTPASDLLHVLQLKPHSEVQALQAEDDAAAAAIALGAAFGGAIGVAAASGSGLSQMSEVLSLAVMTELPLVIFVIQRGGPSTGLPTKVEQADLNLAMYGRNGECPLPVLAAATPGDCFHRAHEAIHIACRYMTPVIVLSDVYLAGGAEAWRLPAVESLAEAAWPDMPPATAYLPYQRDALGVRPWATPGMPGYEHRIGGLEKEDGTGNVNYEPLNHERMTRLRSRRITEIAASLPLLTIDDPDGAELLVLGWGSTQAAISGAVQQARSSGHKVAQAHLGHLHPLPTNTGELLRRYQRVIVPELNHGQLRRLLRSELMIDAIGLSKVQGRPFQVSEIAAALMRYSKSNAKT
jgi:2-oxoglutarate ferredoxin oxidoreductase subunit alpha